jgi:hypothetical protein
VIFGARVQIFVLLILPDLLYGNLKPKRGKLAMLKFVCVLFSVLFVAPLASAEIFKCVGKYGEDLYQNFPCEFDSIGGTPQFESKGGVPSIGRVPMDSQGPRKSAAVPAEPGLGMTTEDVRAIWGEPSDTVQEEPGKGSRFEVWSYGDSRSVRFDHRGRVTDITL